MMMQELPMDQMALQGGVPPGHPHPLDLKEEVSAGETKPWSSEMKPWEPKMMSDMEGRHGGWSSATVHREDYEEDRHLKLENGHRGGPRVDYLDPAEEGYGPPYGGGGGGPQSSPFPEGPPTPLGFSPDQMMHKGPTDSGPNASKKSTSRRNAWGNLSYADLITQAILSSPEKRLTLSQVYDWMVQNIPYFKDKGDSNSSAGWKNSIRHNLSLHNKFVRVQNEGTGKSSWWMINPDAKTGGKSSRRRASNTEPGKGYDNKRRGRSKKSLDLLRGGPDSTPSPNGMVEGFPEGAMHPGFPFHHDIRLRAGGPEFVGGRISPGPVGIHDFYPEGWHNQEYAAMGYGIPPEFRPGFCEMPEQEQLAMMERMGIPTHVARHGNGFYRSPPFPGAGQESGGYPHSPILTQPNTENQFPAVQTLSPATISPNPHSFPSPDHTHQPSTPASREPLMSPHHQGNQTTAGGGSQQQQQQQAVYFPGAGSCGMPAPDSPAPGSSSSSGSILERALAKQEPPSPHSLAGTAAESAPTSHAHPPHPPPHQHPEWPPHVSQGFSDVNVDDYIKHDFGMEGMVEYQGYAAHPTSQQGEEHHQYSHHTSVSVGPPWVR